MTVATPEDISKLLDLIAELRDEKRALLRALESVECGLLAEWYRRDGSGKHLSVLIERASKAITAADGDSVCTRRKNGCDNCRNYRDPKPGEHSTPCEDCGRLVKYEIGRQYGGSQ